MSPAHPRLAAALEGRYCIEHEIGAGGMATVYLAEVLKHDRKSRSRSSLVPVPEDPRLGARLPDPAGHSIS